MSGLRVPVFFGSILTLVVLVLQNRTPTFAVTLLGIRSQTLPLGGLVAIAVISGILLGSILQRTGRRSRSNSRTKAYQPTTDYDGPAEFQPLRSVPDSDEDETDESDEWDEANVFSSPTKMKAKGWDSGVSESWTEQAEEAEGRFWSRREARPQHGSVTPINLKRNRDESEAEDRPSVFDAEYRIVPPAQQEQENRKPERRDQDSGFDENFFDDFFEAVFKFTFVRCTCHQSTRI